MAAAQDIFELFDSYWFEHGIFTRKLLSFPDQTNPVLQIHQQFQEPMISSLPTLQVRSLSDHTLSCKTCFSADSISPDSTLRTPKLETILSGTQLSEFPSKNVKLQEEEEVKVEVETPVKGRVTERERRKSRKKQSSKSLSDLEFEELKGFMDLGFVFSEEDKDSSLVSILPGLQRLKRNSGEDGDGEECNDKYSMVSRPYLSEAWDVLGQRKMENLLMNWRVPSLQNEGNMKDLLRFWAHTVASTVR